MRNQYTLILAFISLILLSHQAFGVRLSVGALSGLMTQPSSSYYHMVNGVKASFGDDKELIFATIQYWERPVHKSSGFSDQDQGLSFFLGSRLGKKESSSSFVGIGFEKISGYIKETSTQSSQQRRGYTINGPSFLMGYRLAFKNFEISLSHQLTAAISNTEQAKSYIAWPFNLLWISFGVHI